MKSIIRRLRGCACAALMSSLKPVANTGFTPSPDRTPPVPSAACHGDGRALRSPPPFLASPPWALAKSSTPKMHAQHIATRLGPVSIPTCAARELVHQHGAPRRVGLSPGARNTTQTAEQSSAQAHSSCEQGTGQRAQELTAQAGEPCAPRGARAPAPRHSTHRATICEHGDHSYLLPSVCAGVSGAGR